MEFEPYIVYVKINSNGYITEVNSSEFLTDLTDWVEIDSGYGDKYHHAQGNYFPKPIMTEGGAYRYKLADRMLQECTEEEIREQEKQVFSDTAVRTLENRVETLEADGAEMKEALEMILSGVVE